MKCLVVGANGLLGSNIIASALQRNVDVVGAFHSTEPNFEIPSVQFDLVNHTSFDTILDQIDPDIVVNCAAMTDVDACEEDPERAKVINGHAPGEMAASCEQRDVDFVHSSTDYVFDGTNHGRYSEEDGPNPIQVYGESKLLGERTVQNETDTALIARLSFVWGINQNNNRLTGFPAWVEEQLKSNEEVPLFTDQWVTPSRAVQAAETMLDLVNQEETGLFHIASNSCVTPYQFGVQLIEQMDASTDVLVKSSLKDVTRKATRPCHTCLDVHKVESTLRRSQPTLGKDIHAVQADL